MWRKGVRDPSVGYGTGAVQAWIKSIEASSAIAGDEQLQFGNPSVTVDKEIDDCYREAQDLLHSWTASKTKHDNFGLEVQDVEDQLLLDTPLVRGTTSVLERAQRVLSGATGESSNKGWQKTAWSSSEPLSEYQSSLFRMDSSLSSHRDADSHTTVAEDTVESVLERMRNVSLDHVSADQLRKPKRVNPLHTMEMRHKQVKERREQRDKARLARLAEQAARKEARRAAEQVVMKEEQQKVQKLKHEDAFIQREMAVLRRELEAERKAKVQSLAKQRRIQQHAETQLWTEGEKKPKESWKREVKSEQQKRLEETKRVLVAQLEIATAEEAKENLRTLKSHFSAWYSVVVQRHVQLGKARAVADWRCLLRLWNAWRTYIQTRRTEKEAERIAEKMKRDHRNNQLADSFARCSLLRHCLSAWETWTRRQLEKRELKTLMEQHKQKMSALLEAAATGALWSEKNKSLVEDTRVSSDSDGSQHDEPKTSTPKKQSSQQQQHPGSNPTHSGRRSEGVHLVTTKKAREYLKKLVDGDREVIQETAGRHRNADEADRNSRTHSVRPSTMEKQPSNGSSSSRPRPLSNTSSNTCEEPVIASDVPRTAVPLLPKPLPLDKVLAGPKRTNKVARRPVKAVGPVGMANRTAEMTEKREARLQRMKELEEEKLAKLKSEEQERLQQEEAERLARIEAKREEKRLAKQREIEKQKHLEHLVRQAARAEEHYQKSLMMTYGLALWKRLITIAKHNEQRAIEHHHQVVMGHCFVPWHQFVEETAKQKGIEALSLYRDLLLKRHFHLWQEFVSLQFGLEAAAEAHYQRVVVNWVLEAWHRFVTNEQLDQMAKGEKAGELHERLLKRRVICCWRRYLPLVREEKLAEVRRNQLRQKVADWLPDFRPTLDTSQ